MGKTLIERLKKGAAGIGLIASLGLGGCTVGLTPFGPVAMMSDSDNNNDEQKLHYIKDFKWGNGKYTGFYLSIDGLFFPQSYGKWVSDDGHVYDGKWDHGRFKGGD